MLIDGYWLQIQDSRMQPRHCANYRPTDTLSIEWWQTGWLLSGNKDRAFLLSCGQTTWTPGFSGFWKSLNHHITIIKSSSMNEDSKECSTTVCIQWHASVIVAEKTLTKLAAAGGHELVRQGCFFCLAGALLVPLSTWLSSTANPHTKCFSRKNTHMQMSSKHEIAYLVQDWIFAKKTPSKNPGSVARSSQTKPVLLQLVQTRRWVTLHQLVQTPQELHQAKWHGLTFSSANFLMESQASSWASSSWASL